MTLEEVVRNFTDAYVSVIEDYDWGYSAVRTIFRMEFDANDDVHALLSKSAGDSVKRFATIARPLMPELTPKQFKYRFNFAIEGIIGGFAGYRNLHLSYMGNLATKDLRILADFYTRMSIAILTAPSR